MAKKREKIPITAAPVKSFFVEMLTRDIELNDAILDLLDNCIDGLARQNIGNSELPYTGFKAEITFDKNQFTIKDNCGGIPEHLVQYAFMMGRPKSFIDGSHRTVGTYGIGMKRAIFKIGRNCDIISKNDDGTFLVPITPEWIANEVNWDLDREFVENKLTSKGTKISITGLTDNVSKLFSHKNGFENDFIKLVQRHYALIIQKGFAVYVNGVQVKAHPIKLLFSEFEDPGKKGTLIRPYIFKASIDDVDVFLAIGFTKPPPSQEELDKDVEGRTYSSKDAGITIICNDRVVEFANKDYLTGWGEAGVANYHTQFIAISGFVDFRSDNARKLPMTTTKRGVNANSELYAEVKNKMREGLKQFIKYTHDWKGREKESKIMLGKAELVGIKEIVAKADEIHFTQVRKGAGGDQYRPKLPKPKPTPKDKKRITFSKKSEEIEIVSAYLFDGDEKRRAADVGEKCFDLIFEEAEE